jgi:hypothetical protein
MALAGALGALALLPAHWALGGTWGLMQAMGDPKPFYPPAGLMGITSLLLFGWMMVVFGAIGMWGGDAVSRFCRLGCCVMSLALLGVGSAFFRAETAWEQMVLGPVLLLLALVAAVLVRGETRVPKLFPW